MELNNCENGSLNMEINDDEEIVMKNKSSLYMKSAEIDCSISSEENTDDNITGKNNSKAQSKPLSNMRVWVIIPVVTLVRDWPQDSAWGRCLSLTTGHLTTFCHPVWPQLKRQSAGGFSRSLSWLRCSWAAVSSGRRTGCSECEYSCWPSTRNLRVLWT